jgi:hypothetical protein
MAEKKNAKYFVFQDKPNLKLPSYRHPMDPKTSHRLVYLDSETVPGAKFYCEAVWLLPGERSQPKQGSKTGNRVEAHSHPFGELMGFFGFNYDNIHDLGAEIELWIDGEKHVITESFSAFIPAGIVHCPLNIRNIVRPIFHFSAGPCELYQ